MEEDKEEEEEATILNELLVLQRLAAVLAELGGDFTLKENKKTFQILPPLSKILSIGSLPDGYAR